MSDREKALQIFMHWHTDNVIYQFLSIEKNSLFWLSKVVQDQKIVMNYSLPIFETAIKHGNPRLYDPDSVDGFSDIARSYREEMLSNIEYYESRLVRKNSRPLDVDENLADTLVAKRVYYKNFIDELLKSKDPPE